MSILLAGLLLSLWGVMIYVAPKRKRYRRWTSVGDSSIDGEENRSSAFPGYPVDSTSDSGAGHHGDAAGHHAGDAGGHHGADAGHGGGDCGSGGDVGGGDCGGGGGGSD